MIKKILFFIFLSIGVNFQVVSGERWSELVANFTNELINTEVQESRVYIYPPSDLSTDKVYLPFSKRILSSVFSALVSSGIQITNNPADAELYLDIGFYQIAEGLSLQGKILNQGGIEILNNSVTLTSVILPMNWSSRSLIDIAYEIAGKFDLQLSGQKVNVVMYGLTGGKSNSDEFISDFTVAMDQYIMAEFGRLPSVVVRDKSDIGRQTHELKGKFRVYGNKVSLSYKLLKKLDKSVIATASTEFTLSPSIPQGMSMYPNNKSVINSTFDDINTGSGKKLPVDAWVNHENSVYRDGDHLEVSIRSNADAYIRVFYVMSDGVICQIQPTSSGDTGFLMAGVIHTIGNKDDDVELIITDDTIGQESIKVFASLAPIEERFLATKYVDGVDYACTDDGYKSLKSGMTRGLNMKQSIRPVNEIKILVK